MELTNTFTVATPVDEMWPILCDIERIAPCMPGAQLSEVEGEEYRGEVKLKVGPINTRFKGTATMVERDDDRHRAVLKASGKDTAGKGNANATITASATTTADGGTEVTITSDLSITGKVAQFGRSAMADISTKLLGQFVDCLESRVLAGGADDAGAGSGEATAGSDAAAAAGPTDGAPSPGEAEAPVVDVTEAATAASAGPGSPVETAPAPPAGGVPAGSAAVGGGTVTASGGDGGEASTTTSSAGGARKVEGPEAEPIDLLETAGAPVAKRLAFPVAAVMALFFALYWRRRRR